MQGLKIEIQCDFTLTAPEAGLIRRVFGRFESVSNGTLTIVLFWLSNKMTAVSGLRPISSSCLYNVSLSSSETMFLSRSTKLNNLSMSMSIGSTCKKTKLQTRQTAQCGNLPRPPAPAGQSPRAAYRRPPPPPPSRSGSRSHCLTSWPHKTHLSCLISIAILVYVCVA